MKLYNAVKAYRAAEKLSYQTGLKRGTSVKVFLLREALRPAYVYNNDEEQKIIDSHPNFDPARGLVKIVDGDVETASKEMNQIKKELDDLHNSEWDEEQFVNLPAQFTISKDEKTDCLTPDDFGALMPFIEFEDEE